MLGNRRQNGRSPAARQSSGTDDSADRRAGDSFTNRFARSSTRSYNMSQSKSVPPQAMPDFQRVQNAMKQLTDY
jgi:hypothetical protein